LDIAVEISAGVRPGEILAGKYRVERVLGWGGMGVVVAAHHLELDQRVALKFLSPQALASAEIVARFAREARAAVRIKSEHVARVTDVGQLDNGSPFMVMEYLDGVDLSGWLAQKGPLPAEQAVDFVLQACEALAEAHALGIVHRDLKPANLFCIRRADGNLSIKVLDFGISKVTAPGASSSSPDMTGTTVIVGSPFYMSPEQMFSSRGVDARTDIWSLGVVLFELLTGRAPFLSESMTELVAKVVTEPAPVLTSLRLDAPPELERVVSRCLEKDRALRFESIAELAVALKDLGSRRARQSVERVLDTMREAGLSAAVLAPSGLHRTSLVPSSGSPGRGTMLQWNRTTSGRRPRDSAAALAKVSMAMLLVVCLAVGGSIVFSRRSRSASASAPVATSAVTASGVPPLDSSTASPVQLPSLPPEAARVDEPSAPASSARPAPAPKGTSTRVARPVTKTPASSEPAAKVSCDPPYYFDEKGSRIFKKECL
jgi:serine/threonine-protein kinase